MSTSTHQTTLQESLHQFETREQRVNPARVFERYLWSNHEVCNECFTQLRTIEEVVRDSWGNTRELRELTEDAVRGWDDNNTGIYRPATFCENCGSRGCAHPETDSKRVATRRAYRIAERLEERDIPVNTVALSTVVRGLKSKEAIQGMDREIYDRATKVAVRRALDHEH